MEPLLLTKAQMSRMGLKGSCNIALAVDRVPLNDDRILLEDDRVPLNDDRVPSKVCEMYDIIEGMKGEHVTRDARPVE